VDAFRYFLLREVPFGLDGDFSKEAMTNRYNNDLANDLGNLLSRTLTMIQQYANDKIPPPGEVGTELQEIANGLSTKVENAMNELAFHRALTEICQLVERVNQYIEQSAPWKLAKEAAHRKQLEAVLYNTAESIRILSLYLYPFMPSTSEAIATQLGLNPKLLFTNGALKKESRWGRLKAGIKVSKGSALFPRIEKPLRKIQIPEEEKKSMQPSLTSQTTKAQIGIEEFTRLDLRVGKVLSAERVPGSEKLLKLIVDIGTEQRQVVAGVSKKYPPESLIGMKVIVVANLKPAHLMGVESQGMILAAGDKEVVALATFLEDVEPGTPIR
jgi:methionyl-tRNA synthetase